MATATATKAPTSPAPKTGPKPAAKKTTRPATKRTTKPAPAKAAAVEPPAAEGGPVLKLFRQGLDAMEKATTTMGETSLSTMSGFGMPEGATKKIVETQAGAMHTVTKVSDRVATAAAKVIEGSVALLAKPFTGSQKAKPKAAAKK